jgi:hypothetical protein
MAIHPGTRQTRQRATNPQADTLHRLIAEQGLGRHALFFVTGEGEEFPGGIEESSGFVLDEQGRVFSFWLGWDRRNARPRLTEWEQAEPEPDWIDEPEYRRAREQVGLPV